MLKKFNCGLFQAQGFPRDTRKRIRQRREGQATLLQVLHRNMRREEGGDILPVADQVSYNSRANEGVLRLREEEHRVDTRKTAVGVGDGLLILEVLDGADAPEDDIRIDLPGEVHRQRVVALHRDMRLVTKCFRDDLIPLLDGEE